MRSDDIVKGIKPDDGQDVILSEGPIKASWPKSSRSPVIGPEQLGGWLCSCTLSHRRKKAPTQPCRLEFAYPVWASIGNAKGQLVILNSGPNWDGVTGGIAIVPVITKSHPCMFLKEPAGIVGSSSVGGSSHH